MSADGMSEDDLCPQCDGQGAEYLVDGSPVICSVCQASGKRPEVMVSLDHCARLWREASTFGELCELTACWLEGRLPQAFTYLGVPDEETADIPAGILTGLNRAGYLTEGSQPGHGWVPGWDGAGYRQRAHVDLLVTEDDVAGLVWPLINRKGLWVNVVKPQWRPKVRNVCRISEAGDNTPEGSEPSCWAGYPHGKGHWWHLAALHRNRAMGRILSSCYQISAVDLEWGRNDLLWDTLVPLAPKETTDYGS